jgi:hypothetical protein
MFFNDHAPPHFHARYGEFEATIDISTLQVIQRELPSRALKLVQEWAIIHIEDLQENRGSAGKLAALPRQRPAGQDRSFAVTRIRLCIGM